MHIQSCKSTNTASIMIVFDSDNILLPKTEQKVVSLWKITEQMPKYNIASSMQLCCVKFKSASSMHIGIAR